MKKLLVLSVLLTLVFFSCTDTDDVIDSPYIRIQNSTQFTFNLVNVAPEDNSFVTVLVGKVSAYKKFDKAYRTTSITVETDSINFNYFPSETVTDSLPVGFYTYELFLDEDSRLNLNFKVD